ncbi:uncharacterized protein AB675_1397 [Cyphellophora attinorum]|uniref:Uncharacterized protein n=1 Tax=Cyphellophora attinorum TaxID=1664694 RepID=A0A0N0NHD2_9EURO|nr:uncharacterized protein AB675_1397 [Phialophora attinorum]KPI34428.1 hypothetical protein AB675_1397 [Phialophora attinorum]
MTGSGIDDSTYCLQPNCGFIKPNSEVKIQVHLRPTRPPWKYLDRERTILGKIFLHYSDLDGFDRGKKTAKSLWPIIRSIPGSRIQWKEIRVVSPASAEKSTQTECENPLPTPTEKPTPAEDDRPVSQATAPEITMKRAGSLRRFLENNGRDINESTRTNDVAREETSKKLQELNETGVELEKDRLALEAHSRLRAVKEVEAALQENRREIKELEVLDLELVQDRRSLRGASALFELFAVEYLEQEGVHVRWSTLKDLADESEQAGPTDEIDLAIDDAKQDGQQLQIKVEEDEDVVAAQRHQDEENDHSTRAHESPNEPPAKRFKSAHTISTGQTLQPPAQHAPVRRSSPADDARLQPSLATNQKVWLKLHFTPGTPHAQARSVTAEQVASVMKHVFFMFNDVDDREDFRAGVKRLFENGSTPPPGDYAKGWTPEEFKGDVAKHCRRRPDRDWCFFGVLAGFSRDLDRGRPHGNDCPYCKKKKHRKCYNVEIVDGARDPDHKDAPTRRLLAARAEMDADLRELTGAILDGTANAAQQKEYSKLIAVEKKSRADARTKGEDVWWIVRRKTQVSSTSA